MEMYGPGFLIGDMWSHLGLLPLYSSPLGPGPRLDPSDLYLYPTPVLFGLDPVCSVVRPDPFTALVKFVIDFIRGLLGVPI